MFLVSDSCGVKWEIATFQSRRHEAVGDVDGAIDPKRNGRLHEEELSHKVGTIPDHIVVGSSLKNQKSIRKCLKPLKNQLYSIDPDTF